MAGLSYADVRDYVTSELGTCSVAPSTIEMNMLGVLEDVRNRMGTDSSKVTKKALSVVAGTAAYDVPEEVGAVYAIENDLGEELFKVSYPDPTATSDTVNSRPSVWYMDNGQIVLWTTPTQAGTYHVRGQAVRSQVLYDVAQDNTKIWRMVELPVGLHFAYAEAVLSQCIMKEDPGRAAMFGASASAKLQNWRNDAGRDPGARRRMLQGAAAATNNYTWGNPRRFGWTGQVTP